MTSANSSPTLARPFPNETFAYIVGFCSPATLAVCCRLSHDSLVLASEPLWTTVRLWRPEQLELLFKSMSVANQAVVHRLPASFAAHLSLQRVRQVTITSSTVLRVPLHLGARFTQCLRPERVVLSHLCYLSTAPVHGLFGPIQPRELVYLLHRDFIAELPRSYSIRVNPRLRSRNVIVVVNSLGGASPSPFSERPVVDEIHTLFYGPDALKSGPRPRTPSKPVTLRFVLRPSACFDPASVKAFLGVRLRQGSLDPVWFQSKPKSFIVEVPAAKVKAWIEQGMSSIPVASRKLVVVEVRPPGSWSGTGPER